MVSPKIQKDICHCFAQEILKSILTEIGDDVFAILVDESSNVSKKEQMVVVLRFVDGTCGLIKERFVGLVHVKETSSLTLKLAIDSLLTELGLSLKKIRGQGYDGASNMRGEKDAQKRQANGLQIYFTSFDFVFYLHLMLHIFGLTESLTKALQRKDQDILNVISLVKSTKRQLQKFRLDGWVPLLEKIFSFCDKYGIEKLNMTNPFINPKNRRQKTGITYEHYYSFDCFNVVVDMQLAEFDDHFNEVNSELLSCMAALDPRDLFGAFDSLQLVRLVDFYPDDFSSSEKISIERELEIYIDNVGEDERFAHLNGIGDLARVMVQKKKHLSYPLLCQLLKLALVLPVATATVERCFSTMKLVKSDLRNRIGDEYLSYCLISAIEKEALAKVTNDDIIDRFQKMKTRREQL
ncbi:hypothetical protein POM88_050828 [Heracleum sosnowskyi]|uniref:Zinc finger MYM-type protein 1-like n=1 Tax=Heracleum sosnowskyi TaxID=360622 RepID=A0AAD8M2W8_9APIA|nr:hypothetical protein POM88_050828 [Heracleum sosnowskyi]